MSPAQLIRERTPAERVAYIAGFADGWKRALKERETSATFEAAIGRLDDVLDLMSAVENDLRERER